MSAVAQASAIMRGAGQNGDSGEIVGERRPGARVHGVRHRAAVDLRPMAIVPGGRHGTVDQLQHAGELPRAGNRLLVTNSPSTAIRLPPTRTHLAIDSDEPGFHAEGSS